MSETKKQKQAVVNVTEESKTKIAEYKTRYNLSDKEFISTILTVVEDIEPEALGKAVEKVMIEKQAAKLRAKIARIEAELAAAVEEATAE